VHTSIATPTLQYSDTGDSQSTIRDYRQHGNTNTNTSGFGTDTSNQSRSTRSGSNSGYTYTDDDSFDADSAEVEEALNLIDDELDQTEETLSQWSRAPSSTASSAVSGYTGAGTTFSTGLDITAPTVDRNRLSSITERTESYTTRPLSSSGSSSYGRSDVYHSRYTTDPGSTILSTTDYTYPLAPPPGRRARDLIAKYESSGSEVSSTSLASPSFLGHSRTASAPTGPRSLSPTKGSQTSYGYSTTYGNTGYGYSSRPGSPSKYSQTPTQSQSSDYTPSILSSTTRPTTSLGTYTPRTPFTATSASVLSRTTATSVQSPYQSSSSGESTVTGRPYSVANTYTSVGGPYASTVGATSYTGVTGTGTPYTGSSYTTSLPSATGSVSGASASSYTATNTTYTNLTNPTTASLRQPQQPASTLRSPLTSVRNIVAAWKDRTPLSKRKSGGIDTRKTSPSASSSALGSDLGTEYVSEYVSEFASEFAPRDMDEGLFSLRRRAERGTARLREQATGLRDPLETPRKASSGSNLGSGLGVNVPPPFDMSELGSSHGSQEVKYPFSLQGNQSADVNT
jgi:hypothetical protein